MQQSKINDIYPNRKPFMDLDGGNKRKATGRDLRVQTLIAQETAKRQCTGPSGVAAQQQEQQPPAFGNGAPTDFAGFFNQLQQEQQHGQQQQQCVVGLQRAQIEAAQFAPAGGPPHQQQQQQAGGVLTLDQLLDHHDLHSRDRPPERQLQHMMSLDRVFAADASRDGFGQAQHSGGAAAGAGSSGAAAALLAARQAQAAQQQWHLTQLAGVPWDWSVKAGVRLASAEPLAVLEEGRDAGMGGMLAAVAAAAAGTHVGAQQQQQAACSQERLEQALMQWQYPAAALPPSLLAGQAAGAAAEQAAAAPILQERVQTWRAALRAAYVAVRHGHCPVLYVCGQAFRQPFTAVLCAPGVMGSSGRMTAVVSRANRQLRAHLASFGAEGLLAGHAEAAQVGNGAQQPAAAFDGQPGSQLMLCGALQVHGLYAALLALPCCGPDQPDVPLLSAPVPFLHAQLCSLRLEVLPDVVLEQQQHARGAGEALPQPLHYAELRAPGGVIMPWTLHRMLRLLRDSQDARGGFTAYLSTEPSSAGLNVLPEQWASAEAAAAAAAAAGDAIDAHAAAAACYALGGRAAAGFGCDALRGGPAHWQREGRGFWAEEVAAWGGSAVLLQGRALRQLCVEGGDMAARLA